MKVDCIHMRGIACNYLLGKCKSRVHDDIVAMAAEDERCYCALGRRLLVGQFLYLCSCFFVCACTCLLYFPKEDPMGSKHRRRV